MEASSIRHDVYKVLHDLLKDNVSEVNGRVYSSYPLTKVKLPLLIISGVGIKPVRFLSAQGFEVTVPIEVYTKKKSDVDLLSDEIISVLKNNMSLLWDNQMYLLDYYDNTSFDNNFVDDNNNVGHYNVITLILRVIK